MSLHQTIIHDQLEARKQHNEQRLMLLQVLLSALKNEQIDKGLSRTDDLDDEVVVHVLRKQSKQLRDALVDFERGGRNDLVEKSRQEIAIIESYLPAQMVDEELSSVVKNVIEELHPTTNSDFGRVMGEVMKRVKGKADGGKVRAMIEGLMNMSSH